MTVAELVERLKNLAPETEIAAFLVDRPQADRWDQGTFDYMGDIVCSFIINGRYVPIEFEKTGLTPIA